MKRIRIPLLAKELAKQSLRANKSLPKYKRVGLTKQQAEKLGIQSGIERAKQLIRNKTVSIKDAKSIASFYNRFKGFRTKRANLAINLWGGRKFGKDLNTILKQIKRGES